MKRGLLTNFSFSIAQDFLQLIQMLVLIRLLFPDDYGQFSLIMGAYGVVNIFAHQSFITHFLFIKSNAEIELNSHVSFSLIVQLLLLCLINLLAFYLSGNSNYTLLSLALHVLSVTTLIEWLSEVSFKISERQGIWLRRRVIQLFSFVIFGALGIWMAFRGYGVWSLLVPVIMQNCLFVFELFFKQRYRLHWSYDRQLWGVIFRFGLVRILASAAVRLKAALDPWAIAYFSTVADVGLFARGMGLTQLLTVKVATVLMYTALPVLSQLTLSKKESVKSLSELFVLFIVVSGPGAIFVSAYPNFFVNLFFGDEWNDVIILIKPLIICLFLASLAHISVVSLLALSYFKSSVLLDYLILGVHLIPVAVFFLSGMSFDMIDYIYLLSVGYLFILLCILCLLMMTRSVEAFVVVKLFFRLTFCFIPIVFFAIFFEAIIDHVIPFIFTVYLYLIAVRFLMYHELHEYFGLLKRFKILGTLLILKD